MNHGVNEFMTLIENSAERLLTPWHRPISVCIITLFSVPRTGCRQFRTNGESVFMNTLVELLTDSVVSHNEQEAYRITSTSSLASRQHIVLQISCVT